MQHLHSILPCTIHCLVSEDVADFRSFPQTSNPFVTSGIRWTYACHMPDMGSGALSLSL